LARAKSGPVVPVPCCRARQLPGRATRTYGLRIRPAGSAWRYRAAGLRAVEGPAAEHMCAVAGSRAYGPAVEFGVWPWPGLLVPVAALRRPCGQGPCGFCAGWRPGAVVSLLW
jgi:hypothetical protein